jgi:hypothetical protein
VYRPAKRGRGDDNLSRSTIFPIRNVNFVEIEDQLGDIAMYTFI